MSAGVILEAMSGFEIAGVVLGVLPLIVEAFEKYEKIVDLVVTYRKYSKAVARFNTELSVQKVIFQNECILLLSHVEDEDSLRDMFHQSSHSLRKDLRNNHQLERRLVQKINGETTYRQIAALLHLISQTLQQIYEETKDHRDSLGQRPQAPEVSRTLFYSSSCAVFNAPAF